MVKQPHENSQEMVGHCKLTENARSFREKKNILTSSTLSVFFVRLMAQEIMHYIMLDIFKDHLTAQSFFTRILLFFSAVDEYS